MVGIDGAMREVLVQRYERSQLRIWIPTCNRAVRPTELRGKKKSFTRQHIVIIILKISIHPAISAD